MAGLLASSRRLALFGASGATLLGLFGCSDPDRTPHPTPPRDGTEIYPDGSIDATAECNPAGGSAAVALPEHLHNLDSNTGWYSSPAIVELSDGTTSSRALVVPSYDVHVYSATGELLDHIERGEQWSGRIYPPIPIGDFDGDGATDLALGGSDGTAAAFTWTAEGFELKPGWAETNTCSAGQCPETRGMAAADLDGDGTVEIVYTTTNTADGAAHVFVFSADGSTYQPAGLTDWQAWPRYNTATGPGGDADFNGQGNHGYGCFGLNVAIGNIDDDPELEVIATYDNHHINAFNHDGTSLLTSSYFTNRSSDYSGERLGWGQFIRYADPDVEHQHYHLHEGDWPGPTTEMWLQWTASPPNVADIDGDGRNEVLGFPNGERNEPYETQAYLLMVLMGNHGDGEDAGMRLPGFEQLPSSDKPPVREPGDWYPPSGVPSPVVVNLLGDEAPEIVASLNDGYVYAFSSTGQRLWRYDVSGGTPKVFSSEPTVADLNADGRPEVIVGVYSMLGNGGKLLILENTGALVHEVVLPDQGQNGNGIGVPAAPTVGDLDGDGQLEIVALTFDHGVDVFTVPGSQANCSPWATGRGNLLRNAQGPATAP